MLHDAVATTVFKIVQRPAGFGYTHDGPLQLAALGEPLEGRENLLVGKIPRGTKENQRIRHNLLHEASFQDLWEDARPRVHKCVVIFPMIPPLRFLCK